jgi:mannose-1-phosphate guanylyltransferase
MSLCEVIMAGGSGTRLWPLSIAEHWIVLTGSAKVTNGDKTFLLSKNKSTVIPLGVVHALENPGKINHELIVV